MKRIICVLLALFLSLNAFCGIWDNFKNAYDDAKNPPLIKIMGDFTKDVTPQLKQRIIELAQKDPDKLRKQLSEQNNDGYTPLFYAVLMMDEQLLDMMLDGLSIYAKDVINKHSYENFSVLACALCIDNDFRRTNIVKKLIEKGADCNFKWNDSESKNISILFYATQTKDKEIIDLVLSNVSSVEYIMKYKDTDDYFETTPLMALIYYCGNNNDYIDCFRKMLEKGANPNAMSKMNDIETTPMHYVAGYYNNKTLYNLLKQYGGDSKLPDSEGHTPFEILAGFCENDADRLFLAYEEK